MAKASLSSIVRWCETQLRPGEIQDYDGAFNGLQVENRGSVTRVAAAVDASLATVRLAIAEDADLMVVHHGLFWNARHPWTGRQYELLRLLIDNDLAVYSSHLPLDVHPRLGNNARLCAALGLRPLRPFFHEKGRAIGYQATAALPLETVRRRLEKATGTSAILIPGGPRECRRIGVVTGGAGSHLTTVAREGVDTFITGEGPHWTYAQAEELGINVLYGGHYATETFGVKALAAAMSKRFSVSTVFIDHPTGL